MKTAKQKTNLLCNIVLLCIIAICFTSCNKELDFTKSSYKFLSKSTNVYSSPEGPIVGRFVIKKEDYCAYIEVNDSTIKNGWIPSTLKGFKGIKYLKTSDMKKMTTTERYQMTEGKATLFSKKWWSNTLNYVELPTFGIWTLWAALALGILLITSFVTDSYTHYTMILLLCLNICEYLYFMTYEGDRIWFIDFENNLLLSIIPTVIISIIIIFQIKAVDSLLIDLYGYNTPAPTLLTTFPFYGLFTLASWWMGQVSNYDAAVAFIEKAFWVVMAIITLLYIIYADSFKNKIYVAIIFTTSFTAIFLVLSYSFSSIIYILFLYKFITNLPNITTDVIKTIGTAPYSANEGEGEEVEVYIEGYGTRKGTIRGGVFYGGGIEAYDMGGGVWRRADIGDGYIETLKKHESGNADND